MPAPQPTRAPPPRTPSPALPDPGRDRRADGLPLAYRVRDIRIFPNVVLAPMEGVTDLSFRRLVRAIGGAGLTCTEFLPSSGLAAATGPLRGRAQRMADFDPDERPVSLQIYGRDPQTMADAARVVQDLGATLVDINMGCPSKKVCAHSGGSALMADLALAAQIVRAVRAAISAPLTVKMRSGFDRGHRNAAELAWICQEEGAEALTVHWRTREDLYGGTRAVDQIAAAKARVRVPVLGNGDVVDPRSARQMLEETGCDGVMVGRGAMRNPWSLRQIAESLLDVPLTVPTSDERERVLMGFLTTLRAEWGREGAALGRVKRVANHFCAGRPGGERYLRQAVLRAQTADEAEEAARGYFERLRAHEAGDPDALPSDGEPGLQPTDIQPSSISHM